LRHSFWESVWAGVLEVNLKEVIIEYQFTLDEATAASIEVTKSVGKFTVFIPWLGLILLFFCLLGMIASNWSALDVLPTVIVGIVFAAMPLINIWTIRRRVRKLPSLNNIIKWRITETDLHLTTEGAEARFIWDKIIKVQERRNGFLLFPQPRLAHWIPKHGFQSDTDIEMLREILRNSSSKMKG
jgi:hypothetical protein